MKFSDTVKLARPELKITHAHDAWLAANDHPVYSQAAIDFAVRQLSRQGDRVRLGTLSPSALGDCMRYQQFVWLGMPKLPNDAQAQQRMHNGMMMHLRWQMAGLTAGWLKDAEVPVRYDKLSLVGTLDGMCTDRAVLEIKSINGRGFSQVVTFGPLHEHQMQMAGYLICTGLEHGVFIYENKDNQDYREIRVSEADLPMDEAYGRAQALLARNADHELYDPLDKCMDRDGWRYRSCPFRDRCLDIYGWQEVSDAS